MEIHVNVENLPVEATVLDADDFSSFKVVVNRPEHVYVTVDELARLVGPRADDPAWREQLVAMLQYARSKGWTREEDGAIQAHIDWTA